MLDSRKSLFQHGFQSQPLDMSSPAKSSLPNVGLQAKPLDMTSRPKSSEAEHDHSGVVHDDPFQHDILEPVLDATDLVPEVQQHEDVHHIAFLPGTVANVDYLVWRDSKFLDEKCLRNYFFLATGTRPWCLRAFLSIPVGDIWSYMKTRIVTNMNNPVLSYQGSLVNLANDLFYYPPNSTFVIVDGEIPDESKAHSGKLWQCKVCHSAYIAKKGFKKSRNLI